MVQAVEKVCGMALSLLMSSYGYARLRAHLKAKKLPQFLLGMFIFSCLPGTCPEHLSVIPYCQAASR